MDLGRELRRVRKERGLTQVEAGEQISISGQQVSNYETGRRYPCGLYERAVLKWLYVSREQKQAKRSEEPNSTPKGLHLWAEKYIKAANCLLRDDNLVPVHHFLYWHGIELALKSFLRAKDATEDDLKELGHDLEKILKEAREQGLEGHIPLTLKGIKKIRRLSGPYKDKDLEYHRSPRRVSLPLLPNLGDVANRLLKELKGLAEEATRRTGNSHGC